MVTIGLRYDLRNRTDGEVSAATLYQACVEQCAWGDRHGIDFVALSEHHGAEDGFLPAPLTLAAAVVGATERVSVTVAALLLPLHDPVRIAEQLVVLDLLSSGRVVVVVGAGYRPEEFAMAGLDRSERGRLIEEYVDVMRRAWTGEEFEWCGRRILVTPRPVTRPHPVLMLGGSSELAARRAARLRLGFFPSIGDPALAAVYTEECAAVGFTEGFTSMPSGPGFVYVTEDPERDWERLAPYVLHDARTYASWQTPDIRSAVYVEGSDLDAVKGSGVYRVVTPDECVALAETLEPTGSIVLHPLLAGMPPELGMESLDLFASKVLPRIRPDV